MHTPVLHAATLFFIGDSEIQEVCPKRRINPIYYGNLELQLLDHIFFHDPAFDVNTLCTRPIAKLSGISSQSGWFPVAGAISSNNVAFVKFLVEHGLGNARSDSTQISITHGLTARRRAKVSRFVLQSIFPFWATRASPMCFDYTLFTFALLCICTNDHNARGEKRRFRVP